MSQTPIRIFLVSSDPELTQRLLDALMAQPDFQIVGQTTDLDGAIQQAKATAPDIILVSERLEGEEERLRQLAVQAPFASVIAVCPREDTLSAQRALLAGARAFVLEPFDNEELYTVIREVHEVEQARRAQLEQSATTSEAETPASSRGEVLALLSAKGGAGRSTIAANLALLLHRETGKEVVLVDAQRTLGDLDTMLNLVPTSTLADLGKSTAQLDSAYLRSVLLKHANGIHVLLAPQQLDESNIPDQEGFARVLELVREMFDYVVVDTGALTDPYTPVVLQYADHILLVLVPEMPVLQRTGLFIETAREHGFPLDRILLVLNRATAQGGITQQHIQDRLGMEVPFVIPEDISLVTFSINQGIPLVISHPKSAVTQSLSRMVHKLVRNGASRLAIEGNGGGWQGLPQRLRKLLSHSWIASFR